MNEAEKALVEALRSGRYTQGKNYLRRGSCFCCLGVACDINPDLGTWNDELMFSSLSDNKHPFSTFSVLPEPVQRRLGWATPQGHLDLHDRKGMEQTLLGLNDRGFSFSQIADIIEAGLVLHNE